MKRPEGKGLAALEKALEEARLLHAEAVGIVEDGCSTTRVELGLAQDRDIALLSEMAESTAALVDVDSEIAKREAALAPLYRRRAELNTDNLSQAGQYSENWKTIEELRARIDAERAANAPLEERRRKDVERLERRIALKRARGPGLPALFIGGEGGGA